MSTFDHKGRAFRAEIRAKADPSRAWEAWTDPARLAQWFVDRATGEVKAGGTYTWFFDEFRFEIPYQVVEAEPGRRFVLKGEIPGRPPGFLEIVIERDGAHAVIRLINSGFQEGAAFDEEYEGIASGWRQALAMLALYLERYFGRPKKTLLLMRVGAFTYADLRPYYATAEGWRAWRATSASCAGDAYSMELVDGPRASGRVLVDTGREVALSWDEADGLLELKASRWARRRRACACGRRRGAREAWTPPSPPSAPRLTGWPAGCSNSAPRFHSDENARERAPFS